MSEYAMAHCSVASNPFIFKSFFSLGLHLKSSETKSAVSPPLLLVISQNKKGHFPLVCFHVSYKETLVRLSLRVHACLSEYAIAHCSVAADPFF
ncbi:hypothetical protein AAC387_Pa04g1734 [Persea americana]